MKGVPASKLVIGIPLYGHTFTLATDDSGINAPTSGPGDAGTFTRDAGFCSYFEVMHVEVYLAIYVTYDYTLHMIYIYITFCRTH